MNRPLRIGLKTLGAGALSIIASFVTGPWGVCGPTSLAGVIFMLLALPCFLVGAILLVVGLAVMIREWDRDRGRAPRLDTNHGPRL